MKPLIIYHGNCADGFTAAWLANIAWHEQHSINVGLPEDWVVDHHAGTYGKPPPDITGRDVYILDFSYKPEVMQVICDEAKFVTHIDHHASAIKDMQGFTHKRYLPVLDDSRSGAYLTAKYFWPDKEPSEMVKMVDDRDRWQFHDVRTRPFHASLFSRPYKIGEWNKVAADVQGAVIEGAAIDRKHFKDINELLDVSMQWEEVDGYNVPVVNLPYTMASDACDIMLQRHPNAQFACAWFMRADDHMVFSFRSRPGEIDVSEIARKFGGGGHVNSSGCAVRSWPGHDND